MGVLRDMEDRSKSQFVITPSKRSFLASIDRLRTLKKLITVIKSMAWKPRMNNQKGMFKHDWDHLCHAKSLMPGATLVGGGGGGEGTADPLCSVYLKRFFKLYYAINLFKTILLKSTNVKFYIAFLFSGPLFWIFWICWQLTPRTIHRVPKKMVVGTFTHNSSRAIT